MTITAPERERLLALATRMKEQAKREDDSWHPQGHTPGVNTSLVEDWADEIEALASPPAQRKPPALPDGWEHHEGLDEYHGPDGEACYCHSDSATFEVDANGLVQIEVPTAVLRALMADPKAQP